MLRNALWWESQEPNLNFLFAQHGCKQWILARFNTFHEHRDAGYWHPCLLGIVFGISHGSKGYDAQGTRIPEPHLLCCVHRRQLPCCVCREGVQE
jgi:hypothetical protein